MLETRRLLRSAAAHGALDPSEIRGNSAAARSGHLAYMSSSVLSSPTPRMRSNPSVSSCRMVESAFPLLMRKGWMTMYFFMGAITTRTCSFCSVCRIGAGDKICWMRPGNQAVSDKKMAGPSPHKTLLGFEGLKWPLSRRNIVGRGGHSVSGNVISPPASARSVAGGFLPESARSRDLCPESAT